MTTTVRKPKAAIPVRKPPRDSRARVAELEAELAIVDEVGQALAKRLDLEGVTELVGERLHTLFPDVGLFVALYHPETNLMSFPYEIIAGSRYHTDPMPASSGLTATVIRSRQPLLARTEQETAAAGAIIVGDKITTRSWLGVPLVANEDVIGAIALESERAGAFDEDDVRLVSALASKTAAALQNVKLFAETTQRNAELAVINEIGEALAKQLDFDAIVDLVGDRLVSMFKAQALYIALHDQVSNLIRYPYEIEDGRRLHRQPIELGSGLASQVLSERRPLRFGTLEEQDASDPGARAGIYEETDSGEISQSWLGVPIMAGPGAIGVVVLGDTTPNKFSEADERLVSTIASSMGVALENARLFDETKHLLTETEQRNAELAVINEIGEALAKQLDFQGIIDAVGDQVTQILGTSDLAIGMFDERTGQISFPYWLDYGVRKYDVEPVERGEGVTSIVIRTGEAVRLATAGEAEALGARWVGEKSESSLVVPIRTGDRVIGVMSLGKREAHAFTEADERLVSTIASSMGVALENARLFGETKRLLTETEQRNAELAVINEIGAALAKQLDFQGIIDAVGDRVLEILNSNDLTIGILDPQTELISFPYYMDNGERGRQGPPLKLGEGLTSRVLNSGKPLRTGTVAESNALGVVWQGAQQPSYLGVPIPGADRVIGVMAVASFDENRFTAADEQLFSTIATSMGVALENARLFDETKHLLTETEQRNAELAVINEIGEALAKQLDFQGIIDAVGDKVGEVLGSQDLTIAILDEPSQMISFPFWTEGGIRNFEIPTVQLGVGLTSRVMHSTVPVRVGTVAEAAALGAQLQGDMDQDVQESYLGVPISSGLRSIGVLAVSKVERDAFTERDEQLISTIASSMGVALENARLFDETKRLLTETEQHASELLIINEIGSALAEQLDFTAIVDLVGDRLVSMFKVLDLYIALYDRKHKMISFPYEIDAGRRVHGEPIEFGEGLTSRVLKERRPYRFGSLAEVTAHGGFMGTYAEAVEGSATESWLGVPIMAGREAIGVVAMGDPAPDKFSEADERLVTTIASSMGVALENARLFDETKWLLTETEQRNAELAVINEIGEALAKQLDFDGIIEAVGEKVRSIFRTTTAVIVLYDQATETLRTPYAIDSGTRITDAELRPLNGLAGEVVRSRRPLRNRHRRGIQRTWRVRPGQHRCRVVAGRSHPRRRSYARRHRP